MADVTRVPNITVASSPPACPFTGDLWWNTVNGQLLVYYDDGSSQQWVIANSAPPGAP